jgi:hypothetical protein
LSEPAALRWLWYHGTANKDSFMGIALVDLEVPEDFLDRLKGVAE